MTAVMSAPADEERLRPLYARVLRLRHVDPGGVLCFAFFEGTVALGLLLALAELVTWWSVPVLPAIVAVLVKANDLVVAAVVRSAARVPAQEQERFRRQIQPAIGRASVPKRSLIGAGETHRMTAPGRRTTGAAPPRRTARGNRLPARLLVGSPFSMTAVLRARLEFGGRRRSPADPTTIEPADGDGTGATTGQPAVRPRSGLPQTRQAALPPTGAAIARAWNSGLAERLDQRPVRRWLSRQNPIDTSRQSARRRYR